MPDRLGFQPRKAEVQAAPALPSPQYLAPSALWGPRSPSAEGGGPSSGVSAMCSSASFISSDVEFPMKAPRGTGVGNPLLSTQGYNPATVPAGGRDPSRSRGSGVGV